MTAPVVRLLDQRRYDPPRLVEVEHDGGWWPGLQTAWRLCGRPPRLNGRRDVTWTEQHDWGLGEYLLFATGIERRERRPLIVGPDGLRYRTPA
jgi:hypothetical protein